MRLPTMLVRMPRPRKRSSPPPLDIEAQRLERTPLPSPPIVIDSKAERSVHFPLETPEAVPPPAYDTVVSGEREEVAAATLSSERCCDGQQPTVMVLFREDYDWARAYLRDLDYRQTLRRALRRHLYKWYLLAIIIITITALVSAKHTTIVQFCQPITQRIREWPAGWLIPIALLIVVSFPPLIGHEIIGILVGLVYGLGIGFAILAAGTFFGELATWVAFKWLCTARAAKFEKRNKLYASLTQLIREKSFMFVLILRFSAVPGHITTAVSASAGANVWSYCAAAFLTLPKQLVIVYLGTAFGQHSFKNTLISWIATIITFIGTIIAAAYIYYHMRIVIRRGGGNRLPVSSTSATATGASPTWADVEVCGAEGVGAGVRIDMQEVGGARRSIDVIIGPHARKPWLAAQAHQRLLEAPTHVGSIRTPSRTRSLPGPITDDEMRVWLAQLDTALITGSDTPQIRVLGPSSPLGHGVDDDEIGINGIASSRAAQGDLPPLPFAPDLLSPPPPEPRPSGESKTSPLVSGLALPDLAYENVYPPVLVAPTPSILASPSSRPSPSHTPVPSIALTRPTHTPARSRADSLRGTVSLDIERPRLRPGGREIADDADIYAIEHGGRRRDYGRSRGDSRAALLGRPDQEDADD